MSGRNPPGASFRNRRFLPRCLPADPFDCQLRRHAGGKSFYPERRFSFVRKLGRLSETPTTAITASLPPSNCDGYVAGVIGPPRRIRRGGSPAPKYFQDFSFLMLYISSDVAGHANSRYTSEKAFTPIPSGEIWLPIAIRSFFGIAGYGPRMYPRCDSFIYKPATDVIRISFNTLHLLFTSPRAPPPRRGKPMSECVHLSIYPCGNVSSRLTSGLLVESKSRLSLTFERARYWGKSIGFISYLMILSPSPSLFLSLVRVLSSYRDL